MSDYKGGRILRIKVKDFMTYDDFEIIPKKGLNIIIGLNGSGKSSLMSAICLGLVGKPQFTGKSTQLSDFIKHGKQKAIIEIELDDPKGKVVIGRIIEGDKSSWYLNGSSVPQSEILDKIKKYNIDVGNLCQFLPQEKVSEFSKMDKKQRLDVIIQAIGEPSLHAMFNELKKKKGEVCVIEKEMKKLEAQKTSQEQMNDRLKKEVEKQEDRKRHEDNLKTYKFQKMIYEYDTKKLQYKEIKKEKKKMQLDIIKLRGELNELESEISDNSSSCIELVEKIKGASVESSKISEELSKCQSKLTDIHAEVDSAKIHYESRKEEKQNQKEKLEDLKRQIQALDSMISNNETKEKDLQESTAQIEAEFKKVRKTIDSIDSNLEEIKLKKNGLEYQNRAYLSRIMGLQNEKNYQMEFLKRAFPHIYEAVCWLEQNKSSFRSTICLPPLLSLKVFKDEDRKFIENIVSLKDLNSFVCTDKEDLKRLTGILITQKNLRVNIGLAPEKNISEFESPTITPGLRSMGVERFATDLFTAPEPLVCYLCSLTNMHNIPICSENSAQYSDSILQRFNRYFTPNERISCSRSRYGSRNKTYRKDFIRCKNLIQSATNENNSQQMIELKEKVNVAKQQIQYLTGQEKDYENQRSIHEKTKEQLLLAKKKNDDFFNQFRSVKIQFQQKVESYSRKKSEVIDEEAERRKLNLTVCSANNQRMSVGEAMKKQSLEFVELKLENVKYILQVKFLTSKLSDLRSGAQEKRLSLQEREERLRVKDLESSELYDELIELKNSIGKGRTVADLRELQANISIEVVEQKIIKLEALLGLCNEDNESVLQDYENLRLSIAEVSSRIEFFENKLQHLKADMEKKKQKWLPAMESHVKTINKNFSKYYKLLKCAGEISLEMGDDPDDFAEYGLQVRLKYRDNEAFSVLSPDHHSGGERNVASIVFILSLQELTTVPFRCVDEINQGMDSANERMMYEFIAADASKTDSCSQYFLLTPKLLKNLNYHKDVTVHIIFNSRYLDTKLNVKHHSEIVKGNC